MSTERTRLRVLSIAACVLSVLVAVAAIGGILIPSVYARETATWAAQGYGQDWVDLLVVAPLLVACAVAIRRRSRAALFVLGGALIYLVYSFVLYAFAMHFNPLFLVYCAALGVSFYMLLGLAVHLYRVDADVWFHDHLPFMRFGGVFLIVVSVGFAALWLSSVIPALVRGSAPAELAEAGLITNPVHVLDLALMLPALCASGVLLLRRRGAGLVLAPIMVSFNALMTLALVGMMIAMRMRGLSADFTVVGAMAVLAAISVFLLISFIRPLRGLTARTA
jgi:hypothetical protein